MIALLISIRRLKNVLRTSAREVVTVLAISCYFESFAHGALPCDTKQVRRFEAAGVPGNGAPDDRPQRPESPDRQFHALENPQEQSGPVELDDGKAITIQHAREFAAGKMLVPSLLRGDIADQSIRIRHVPALVFLAGVPAAVEPPVQPGEAKLQVAHIQEREHMLPGNGDDQGPFILQDTMQLREQGVRLIHVLQHIEQADRGKLALAERQNRLPIDVHDLHLAASGLRQPDGFPADIRADQPADPLVPEPDKEPSIAAPVVQVSRPARRHMLPRKAVAIPAKRVAPPSILVCITRALVARLSSSRTATLATPTGRRPWPTRTFRARTAGSIRAGLTYIHRVIPTSCSMARRSTAGRPGC